MRKAPRGDTGATHLEFGLVVTALGLLIVVMGATFAGALRHTVAEATCPASAAAVVHC